MGKIVREMSTVVACDKSGEPLPVGKHVVCWDHAVQVRLATLRNKLGDGDGFCPACRALYKRVATLTINVTYEDMDDSLCGKEGIDNGLRCVNRTCLGS